MELVDCVAIALFKYCTLGPKMQFLLIPVLLLLEDLDFSLQFALAEVPCGYTH